MLKRGLYDIRGANSGFEKSALLRGVAFGGPAWGVSLRHN